MIKILFALILLMPFTANAQLNVDITSGRVQAMPIAVTNFYAPDDIGNKMAGVIRNNLQFSGLFKPLAENAFIQPPISLASEGPRFAEWKPLNA